MSAYLLLDTAARTRPIHRGRTDGRDRTDGRGGGCGAGSRGRREPLAVLASPQASFRLRSSPPTARVTAP